MSELSPAAQAAMDAYHAAPIVGVFPQDGDQLGVAAALRAVADQVLPAAAPRDRATWSPFAGQIRAEILAIAAELEGQPLPQPTTQPTTKPC